MSDDVLITPGSRKIEFIDSTDTVDAKIETDSSGNLVITNPGGDISLGDTTADIFIGDGVNNIDIVFEQDGEIRGTSGVTVTLGASGSNVRMGTDLNLNSNDITNVNDLTVTGDLTVSGTTTTVNSTNTTIADSIIELNSGLTSANTKDIGFIFERGSTGNNAGFVWDESADRFTVFTTTDTASSDTVNTSSVANFQAGSFFGNGANLTSLNATQLTSGTVPVARLAATVYPGNATELSSSQDLNDLNSSSAGFYYQTANADTTGNNYPSGHAGSLIVQKSAGQATQLYQTYQSDAPQLYFRSNYTSGYGSWQRVFADNYHPNADTLTTARTIGGVSFNGSANIDLPGVNTAGNQDTSGTASHANNLNATDDRDVAPEDLSYSNDFNVYFADKGGLETGTIGSNYQDVLVLNTWSDASGGDANALAFDKSEKKIYHYQADQAATNWGTAKTLAYIDDNITGTAAGLSGTPNISVGTITASGDMAIDTDTLFVDVSANRVGIGEDDVDMKLHISDTTTPGIKFERPGQAAWRAGVSGTSFIFSRTSDTLASPVLTLDSSDNATFAGSVYVGTATTNGGVINLIQSGSNPEIRIQGGESGASLFSIYNTATNPDAEQFFINNTLGSSHLGNKRGALKLESSSGVVLTLGGTSATFAGAISSSGDLAIDTDTLFVDVSTDRVGIGTSSPDHILETSTAMGTSPTNVIFLRQTGTNQTGGGGAIRFDTSASNDDHTLFYSSVEGLRSDQGDGSSELHFKTTMASVSQTPATRMFIQDDGKVGIGTTTPSAMLTAISTADATPALKAQNTGGINGVIQEWIGDSNGMEMFNLDTGDYVLRNTEQNNGIIFRDGTGGLEFQYNGSTVMALDSGGGLALETGAYKIGNNTVISSSRNFTGVQGTFTSFLTAGSGGGGVSLTINDGYGNANVTFNHKSGIPEQAGNCGRIVVNTDSTTGAKMTFELLSNSGTTAVNTPSAMELTETGAYFQQYLYHLSDTDTYLQFTADRVRIAAGGTVKFDSNNTYLTGITSSDVTTALGYTPYQESTALSASSITASSSITMNGQGDFVMDRTDNGFSFVVSSAQETAGQDVIFQQAGGGEVTGCDMILNFTNISIPQKIYHTGDSNCYMEFNNTDQWRVVTSGLERLQVTSGETCINDGSNDYNFRVESNNNTGMLFVDGGTDQVAIGTQTAADMDARFTVQGATIGNTSGDTVLHTTIAGVRHHLDFEEERTASTSDWQNTTYRLGMRVDTTDHQAIEFVSDGSSNEHIDIRTGNRVFNTRFTHDGKVGIGTNAPVGRLHVVGPSGAAGEIFVSDADNGTGSGDALLMSKSGTIGYLYNKDNGSLRLGANNNSSHIVIQTDGDVGIGTASPGTKLDVNVENGASGVRISRGGNDLSTNTTIGSLDFYADYSGGAIPYAHITGYSNNIAGVRAALDFKVKSTSGGILTGMTVYGSNSGARVGINDTTPSNTLDITGSIGISSNTIVNSSRNAFFNELSIGATPSKNFEFASSTLTMGSVDDDDFQVNIKGFGGNSNIYLDDGDIFMYGNQNSNSEFKFTSTGTLHADADVIAYSTTISSDRKLKENVRPIQSPMQKILHLEGVMFDWKEEGRPNDQIGFIAQEVEKIVPEIVTEVETLKTDSDTHKVVNYSAVVPILVEAVKIQQEEIERLKELAHPKCGIESFEGYADLVARIEKLENR